MRRNPTKSRGFSLIELVIVVVIIGIIAAIAIPRMSRGSQGAADSALRGDLSVLRSAIDLYNTEHQKFPDGTTIATQLTSYTDASGATSATQDTTHIYGPYLRTVPIVPVGALKGDKTNGPKIGTTTGTPDAGFGWLYDPNAGNITANTAASDASGTAYNTY